MSEITEEGLQAAFDRAAERERIVRAAQREAARGMRQIKQSRRRHTRYRTVGELLEQEAALGEGLAK